MRRRTPRRGLNHESDKALLFPPVGFRLIYTEKLFFAADEKNPGSSGE